MRCARWIPAVAVYALAAGCSSNAPPDDTPPLQEPQEQPTERLLAVNDTTLATEPTSVIRAGRRHIATRGPSSAGGAVFLYDTERDMVAPILGSAVLGATDFVVAADDVLLRGTDDHVYHFNLLQSVEALSLGRPTLAPDSGRMSSDGGAIVAFVTREPFVCWVDVTAENVQITPFVRPPVHGTYAHTVVSDTRIAALDGEDLVLFDTVDGPFGEPRVFEVAAATVPIAFDGAVIIFADIDYNVYALDVDADEPTPIPLGLALSPADERLQFDYAAGVLCTFEGERPLPFASTVGPTDSLQNAIDVGLAAPTDAGWGTQCAVACDGTAAFVSGSTGSETLLSAWERGIARALEGPAGPIRASHVHTGPGLAAFHIHDGAGNSTLGYIDLQMPDSEP